MMRKTIQMFLESDVYVDEFGMAHDDEGNSWKVGRMSPGVYRPKDVPRASGGYDWKWADKLREPQKSKGKVLHKLVWPRPDKLTDKDLKFIISVRDQMIRRPNRFPTDKQAPIIVKILKRIGWTAEAALFVPEKEKKEKSAAGSHERSDVIKVLDAALERRPNRFLDSIRDQLTRGKSLTDKQKKAVRRNLYQLGMRDDASVFKESVSSVVTFGEQSAITTGGISSLNTKAAHYPGPFMFPILMKPSTVPPGEVKAQAACLKATRAYTQGSITKKELDRLCAGFEE